MGKHDIRFASAARLPDRIAVILPQAVDAHPVKTAQVFLEPVVEPQSVAVLAYARANRVDRTLSPVGTACRERPG